MATATTTTQTQTFHPIAAAMREARKFTGDPLTWTANDGNDLQKTWLQSLPQFTADLANVPEMKQIANTDVRKINKFLKDEGFQIQLKPFTPGGFGMASVMKIAMEWLSAGRKVTIRPAGLAYPPSAVYRGAALTEGVTVFADINPATGIRREPIVQVHTKTGDMVYLQACDVAALANDDLNEIHDAMQSAVARQVRDTNFKGVHFPVIHLDDSPDISWLLGMTCSGPKMQDGAFISQALQQTKFTMDESGAKVESAVAIAMTRNCLASSRPSPPPVIINKTFVVTIVRPGVHWPIFIGKLGPDVWVQ